MAEEILDYIVFLENTLGTFYERIKGLPEFGRATNVLEFMETHSFIHADQIADKRDSLKRPLLPRKLLVNFQNSLTREVMQQVKDEKDIGKVFKILADSEESLAVLYKKISEYLNELSEYYRELSSEVSRIAGEELDHMKLLLKDRERLMKKGK